MARILGWTVLPGLPTDDDITLGRGETMDRSSTWTTTLSSDAAVDAVARTLRGLGDDDTAATRTRVTAALGSQARARMIGAGRGAQHLPITVRVDARDTASGTTLTATITSTPARTDLLSLEEQRSQALDQRAADVLGKLRAATGAPV